MHSSRYNNAFTLCHVLLILFTRDREVFALVACQRLAQSLPLHILLLDGVRQDRVELLDELGVRVWIAVCKIHAVIVVFELIRERHRVQGLEAAAAVFPDAIWVVGDLGAASMPTNITFAGLLLRVDEHLHAFVVQ